MAACTVLYCTVLHYSVLYRTAPVLGPRVELHHLRHLRHPGLRGGGGGGDRAGGGRSKARTRLSIIFKRKHLLDNLEIIFVLSTKDIYIIYLEIGTEPACCCFIFGNV